MSTPRFLQKFIRKFTSFSVSVTKWFTATATGKPNFLTLFICLSKFTTPFFNASTFSLVSSSLPRIRDFRGLSRKSVDGSGNYSLGIREQSIFPEIDYNSIDKVRGLQVVITTTARNNNEGIRLLEGLGMPLIQDTRNKPNN